MTTDHPKRPAPDNPDPFRRLVEIMERLLAPDGCPWDQKQTHSSLKPYVVEEAYEVCEAIDEGDFEELKAELGDLGLQIVFHAALARREGRFDVDDVYRGICEKLIRRHPHVFANTTADDAETVLKNWEQIKREEREEKGGAEAEVSALDGVPKALPALQRADRIQSKARRVGFDWDDAEPVWDKVHEEIEELRAEHGNMDADKLEDSGPDRYTFVEHRRYFDAALEALGVADRVTLVIHDWGSALGFDWAKRHRDAVRGIAYMEAIVRPMSWEEWPDAATPVFQGFRSPAGEAMVLEKNVFVERVLPGSVLRDLSEAEMAVYRRPFGEPGESRRPTLTWPRQIPLDGEPADVVAIVAAYADWLAHSPVPKLFVNADPGAILVGAQREFCRGWPNQTEVTVPGNHFLQEDSPDEIGIAIREWLAVLD